MEEMNGKKLERFVQLLEEAETINESLAWWTDKMDKLLKKIDRAKTEKSALKVKREFELLVARGEMEIKNTKEWEKKKNKLINEK